MSIFALSASGQLVPIIPTQEELAELALITADYQDETDEVSAA